MLTFTDVNFRYKKNQPMIEGFTSTFEAGKTLLLGPNGAGKSTLFALASGLLKPHSGHIDAPSGVGLMGQNVTPFQGLTVREQIAYSGWLSGISMANSWQRSQEKLELVRLGDKANAKARTLSGGQLRRLGIANTLIAATDVMLFDEPSAGLDLKESSNFYKVLGEACGPEKCVVVSSHQIEGLADFFDNVVLIVGGTIKFSGTFESFVALGYELGARDQSQALVNAYSSFVDNE